MGERMLVRIVHDSSHLSRDETSALPHMVWAWIWPLVAEFMHGTFAEMRKLEIGFTKFGPVQSHFMRLVHREAKRVF